MEFSELFHGRRSTFSPDGKFLACLCGDFVEVRFSDSLLKAFKVECVDVIKNVIWSGDSSLLLCQVGRSKLTVFNINCGSSVATLKLSTGSINQIFWAADCRTVVFLEPLLCRVAIWDICDQQNQQSVHFIEHVQPWAKPSVALSPNGKHLALVQSGFTSDSENSGKYPCTENTDKLMTDCISILSAVSWRFETKIEGLSSQRIGGIEWSPNSNVIVTWPIEPPDPVFILCVRSSSIIARWQPSEKLWPGVSEIAFSPSSQFLAIASRNSKVHVLNCVSWCEELELLHDSFIVNPNCHVYRESMGNVLENSEFVQVVERPVSISCLSSVGKVARYSKVAWSSGGRYLASCLALAPAVVWIWSVSHSFKLTCVIITKLPVQDIQWDPVHNVIGLIDGQDSVTFWNGDKNYLKSVSVCTPVSRMLFPGNHLDWRHDGKAIVASSDLNSSLLELSCMD